jgi:Ca2+-binding EF-hand superfamily protein
VKDHSGRITLEEFRHTIRLLKIDMKNEQDIQDLFRQFDTTQNGQIDLKEFLDQLRPSVNARREKAIWNHFNAIDINHDGQLTIHDLKVSSENKRTKSLDVHSFQLKYATKIQANKKHTDQTINEARTRLIWLSMCHVL